jgi:hypothetical protein
MEMLFAAVHESAYGTSRQSRHSSISVASLIGRLGSSVFRLSKRKLTEPRLQKADL